MIIVWKGWGILVVLVTGIALALAGSLIGTAPGHQEWLSTQVGLVLAALIIFPLGRYLNTRPGRVLIDPTSGQAIELCRRHTLFFVRMEYWSALLLLWAALRFVI